MDILPLILWTLLASDASPNDAQAIRPAPDEERVQSSAARRAPADAVPAKVLRYAERLLTRHDRNGDGRLQRSEWSAMPAWAEADRDADGTITVEELVRRIVRYGATRKLRGSLVPAVAPESELPEEDATPAASPARSSTDASPPPSSTQAGEVGGRHTSTRFFVPPKRLPSGLPGWFRERDLDGDAQLTLSEFAPKATRADEQEFAGYDLNADGVITAKECVRAAKPAKADAKR